MSTFKHLLVPIDGSSGADQAIAKALVLATDQQFRQRGDCRSQCCRRAAGRTGYGAGARAQRTQHECAAHHRTSALRITDSKLPTIADQILEEARAHAVDLIVCGSHGKTGFRAMILGSVAEGLIHRGHSIPLLLIPTRPTQR